MEKWHGRPAIAKDGRKTYDALMRRADLAEIGGREGSGGVFYAAAFWLAQESGGALNGGDAKRAALGAFDSFTAMAEGIADSIAQGPRPAFGSVASRTALVRKEGEKGVPEGSERWERIAGAVQCLDAAVFVVNRAKIDVPGAHEVGDFLRAASLAIGIRKE